MCIITARMLITWAETNPNILNTLPTGAASGPRCRVPRSSRAVLSAWEKFKQLLTHAGPQTRSCSFVAELGRWQELVRADGSCSGIRKAREPFFLVPREPLGCAAMSPWARALCSPAARGRGWAGSSRARRDAWNCSEPSKHRGVLLPLAGSDAAPNKVGRWGGKQAGAELGRQHQPRYWSSISPGVGWWPQTKGVQRGDAEGAPRMGSALGEGFVMVWLSAGSGLRSSPAPLAPPVALPQPRSILRAPPPELLPPPGLPGTKFLTPLHQGTRRAARIKDTKGFWG